MTSRGGSTQKDVWRAPVGRRCPKSASIPSISASSGLDEAADVNTFAELPDAGLVNTLAMGTAADIVGYGVQQRAAGGGPPRWVGTFTRYYAPSQLIAAEFSISDRELPLRALAEGRCRPVDELREVDGYAALTWILQRLLLAGRIRDTRRTRIPGPGCVSSIPECHQHSHAALKFHPLRNTRPNSG